MNPQINADEGRKCPSWMDQYCDDAPLPAIAKLAIASGLPRLSAFIGGFKAVCFRQPLPSKPEHVVHVVEAG
ncbi:MAG TPA: hypothetical protein VF386_11105, partial [Usitatibacter sp.]